ncbi:hypothetical protein OW763_10670 [Clostridium aestuarii]|uniref:Transcriptional regulator n=1 Tax=Clostridium aestuarii TaxID=338193 RepID=A0ABT4D0N7_9CLOT|nr:hypothetical protein [Clostridium aestuarii]MCY6484803.1 hypothetical protein [Clostridium aestuarii]
MHLLVFVLNKVDKLDELLLEFTKAKISGATVLDSHGMAEILIDHKQELPMFGSLRLLLNEKRPFNKTIFAVLSDKQIPTALDCIKKVVGDLSKPGVGIVFTLPVNYVDGIRN